MKNTLYLLVFFVVFIVGCEKDHSLFDIPSGDKKDFILAGVTGTDVYYHDLVPDWEKHGFGLVNDTLNVDINSDNIVDLTIRYTTFSTAGEYDQQTSVNCYNGVSVSLAPKSTGDTIHSSPAWTASPSVLCFTKINLATNDTSFTGMWHGKDNKYLGVKIVKGSKIEFGWIRISLLVPPSIPYVQQIIVKDFASREAN